MSDRDLAMVQLMDVVTMLRAETNIERLVARRRVLKREVKTLTEKHAQLTAEIDNLVKRGLSRHLRARFVEDVRKRLDAHGIYETHSRRIDEKLFFMAFNEIVGMGGEQESREIAKSLGQ